MFRSFADHHQADRQSKCIKHDVQYNARTTVVKCWTHEHVCMPLTVLFMACIVLIAAKLGCEIYPMTNATFSASCIFCD